MIATTRMEDLSQKITDYETGELPVEEVIELFQYLLDTGLVWELQGSYGRMAENLIEEKLISL